MASMLYAKNKPITEHISIRIPTVGEVIDNEDVYDDIVSAIIATPYDMMVQLDDIGVDFTKINSFDLFCMLFGRLQEVDTSLVFGDTDLRKFSTQIDERTRKIVLRDEETGALIDRGIHDMIGRFLRKMLCLSKDDKRPANEEARRYMLERARIKQKRRKKSRSSRLENYIVALVNTEQFPYDYMSVRDISIYQFYSSLHQITHKIRFDNTMVGYYAGTVKLDDISQGDRSWIINT